MDSREERVKLAHTYYLEYLKLMNHYDLLEKNQTKQWKELYKHYVASKKGQVEEKSDEQKHPMVALAADFEDRDTKIAQYKFKKEIEANLERLKSYKDEEMKREFYKC